jgi:hypothetical protein
MVLVEKPGILRFLVEARFVAQAFLPVRGLLECGSS